LPDCDGTTNGTTSTTYIPCGQAEIWYEDDSDDATDDLLLTVEVVQGTSVIYDTGTIRTVAQLPPTSYFLAIRTSVPWG